MEEVPHHLYNVPSKLATKVMFGMIGEHLWETRSGHLDRTKPARDILERVAAANENVALVDPTDVLCPTDRCLVIDGSKPLYWDDDHINRTGALFISSLFDRFFDHAEPMPEIVSSTESRASNP